MRNFLREHSNEIICGLFIVAFIIIGIFGAIAIASCGTSVENNPLLDPASPLHRLLLG